MIKICLLRGEDEMNNMQAQNTFKNPILPGFNPDPSICRANDDYYMVTSSFTYFPGVPIFHSKDLVNWRQIGHVLDRKSQLPLGEVEQSSGIFAPTIRYHDGMFYMITTNVAGVGNFIVTATDPAGDWSEPYVIADAPGIDPSLFFDDDGKVYYHGTRPSSTGEKYFGDWEVWLQEIDLSEMRLVGEKHVLWKGALIDSVWPESPHIYKKDGFYYLLIAEGGTGHHHAVTIARSEKLLGSYVGNPGNPVLTHRHLGKDYPIANVGHGDLVKTQNDEWWIALLASRPYGGYYRNMGRETFLVPVIWEDGWPIMSKGTGKVEVSYPKPNLPEHRWPTEPICEHFDGQTLDHKWLTLRAPLGKYSSLSERPGFLRLYLKPDKLTDLSTPSFIGRSQQHISYSATTVMEFSPKQEKEDAGLVVLQSNEYHYRLTRTVIDGSGRIQLIKCAEGKEEVLADVACTFDKIFLRVEARGQDYSFYYGDDLNNLLLLKDKVDGRILSTDVAGGFVGTLVGLYTSSNEKDSTNHADFDWFEYQSLS